MKVQLVALPLLILSMSPAASPDELIPAPRPLELQGLHAYAEKTITAGETIHFRVSSTVPYELSVCRLGHQVEDPAGDEVLFSFPKSQPVQQPIHPWTRVSMPSSRARFFPRDRAR